MKKKALAIALALALTPAPGMAQDFEAGLAQLSASELSAIGDAIGRGWNISHFEGFPNFEQYVVVIEVDVDARGVIVSDVRAVSPSSLDGVFQIAFRQAQLALLRMGQVPLPQGAFPEGLTMQIRFDPGSGIQIDNYLVKTALAAGAAEPVNDGTDEYGMTYAPNVAQTGQLSISQRDFPIYQERLAEDLLREAETVLEDVRGLTAQFRSAEAAVYHVMTWRRLVPQAEQGNAEAQRHLGDMYRDGTGVPQDYAEAARWFRLAAEQGDVGARSIIGMMYDTGTGVPQDYAEAVRWYRLAAEQGDAWAQASLSWMYRTGNGVTQDNSEALNWLRISREQRRLDGTGVPQDYAEAVRWYRLAAEQGNIWSQNRLGSMYLSGNGVVQDSVEAAHWYRMAAEQGNADAQTSMGVLAERGLGVEKDYAEAMRWYQLAAAQGSAVAQFNLGVMYERGNGVAQDYAEAARWYRLLAEQGFAGAQFNLGLMYERGLGVAQDHAEAARWYRLSAARGHAWAQSSLGLMYAEGQGVAQDDATAHMWVNIAAANGHERAREMRDTVASEMTPAAIAEAQRRASVCMASDYQDCD